MLGWAAPGDFCEVGDGLGSGAAPACARAGAGADEEGRRERVRYGCWCVGLGSVIGGYAASDVPYLGGCA